MNENVAKDVAGQIAIGMAVYDAGGSKIGAVLQFDAVNGWLQSEKGILFPRDRYIPFSAIDHISPTGIYLSVPKDYVKDMFDQAPLVDVEPGSVGAAAKGTIRSGYDGSRVVVESTTISTAIERLADGLKVYDANGDKIGRVYQYIAGSDWIVVDRGPFSSDCYIPVTVVNYLDADGVHLRVTKDVLKDTFTLKPGTITVDDARIPEASLAAGTVSTWHDGSRVVVDSATVSVAMDRMGRSPRVYDFDGEDVGSVCQYDAASGWIVVEKGTLVAKDHFIPVTAVDYLDEKGVHLRVTKDVLERAFVVKPASATFVATKA